MAAQSPLDIEVQQHGESIAATPATQHSPQKFSRQRGWSASTDGSKPDYENGTSRSWEMPPMPPIPQDRPPEAWRRRSMKRDSYTSQMSLRRASESAVNVPVAARTPAEDTVRCLSAAGNSSIAGDAALTTIPMAPGGRRTSHSANSTSKNREYEELHWQVSGLNPKSWSRRRKWLHTLGCSGVAFAILFSSTLVAPARSNIEDSFSTSPIVAVLSTALYVLGLGFGSMLGTASSALAGRRVAQSASLLLSIAFTIASACVGSLAALHACRLFAGLCASPTLWISMAIVLQIWPTEKLATPLTTFAGVALAGLALGPVAGSYIIESKSVRWTQYAIIIASSVALALVLAMRETHKGTVQRAAKPPVSQVLRSAVEEPLSIVLKNPAVLLIACYAGAILGMFYTAVSSFVSVLGATYTFSLPDSGLTALALLLGIAVACILLTLDHTFRYRPRVARSRRHYNAEIERTLAEEKHLKRCSHRDSKANMNRLQKRRSDMSLFSSTASDQQVNSRNSLLQPLAKRHSRTDLLATTIDLENKNVALSVAAAEYLNSINGKRILPERVLLILTQEPSFGDMCGQLEAYALRFDRVKLARVLLDALEQQADETRPATAVTAAESTQAMPALRPGLQKMHSVFSQASSLFKAPPAWRLWPALPASVALIASLLLFAWTARSDIHWIPPVIGTGLFAASGTIVLVSSTLYVLERCGEDVIAGGSFVLWLLASLFPIIGVPLFDALETCWAGSVFALVGLIGAVPVWMIAMKGTRIR